ncbi:nucleotide exchange factor GrpE [Mycetocola miduiensis]|uniref:Protein GrpE n=1 Tax=Mycetocola miduiensis TaxID=995034 RepID=A0A1I5AY24_9MICO|nr:nucleotide exchange factor GrpE [Mycetocola miduiensis]SFN67344.1 molecular chaperone GrpE [Mycetocola miduiensis]
MTDKNPTPDNGDEVQPVDEGSEARASDPESQVDSELPETTEDELTVQDILDAAQADGLDEDLGERLADAEPEHEHLVDLKRVTAEYANYRRRTEANREVERERVTGDVAKLLLPVLDDLDRAEKHGDLEGDAPFATIAAKLRASVEKIGLVPFGAKGDPFDHNIHEAVFQQPSPDVEAETVIDVVETGYLIGSTMLRAAKVVVAVPAE